MFILSKKNDDIVLFENERNPKLLQFFRSLHFRLALDIRDNRALQRSAYQLDDSLYKRNMIQKVLLKNLDICDYVFVVSSSCKKLYPRRYYKKICILENASDPYLFTYSKLPACRRVGFMSGIAPGRGMELLIHAVYLVKEKIPDVKLSIAGTPAVGHAEGVKFYVELKEKYESDWISFHDDIYYNVNANQFFKGCYLTVIPHPNHMYYHTTLPVKLFDSLACGRPVVATNCNETATILRSYACGLVADFTANDLAEKIIQLLLDRELASRMGANGRKAIEENYNWDNMAKKMIGIIRG